MSDLVADLKARHAAAGSTPAGALALWFEALRLYLEPASRDAGRALLGYLTIPFKKDERWDRKSSNLTFAGRLKDARHHHIFRSYYEGTSPENGYTLPANPQLAIVRDEPDAHGRGHVIALRSSGADNPRPVYLKKSTKTGLYFVDGHANVYVGIRAPKDPDDEEFV